MRLVEGLLENFPAKEMGQSGPATYSLNATGDKLHFIGQLYIRLPEPSGVSKVISSAGGEIIFGSSLANIGNASTEVRIGIQNLNMSSTPATGNGTFTTQCYHTGSAPTITGPSSPYFEAIAPMTHGTDTLTHGDMVAICMEMPARGSLDTIQIGLHRDLLWTDNTSHLPSSIPYVLTGSGLTLDSVRSLVRACRIKFNDGTIGHIYPYAAIYQQNVINGPSDGSRGISFTVETPIKVEGVRWIGERARSEHKVQLHRDPFGSTPTLLAETTTEGPEYGITGARVQFAVFPTPIILQPGVYSATLYSAVSVLPIRVNSLQNSYYHKEMGGWIAKHHYITRNGGTGAFTIGKDGADRDIIPFLQLIISAKGIPTARAGYHIGI